MYDATVGRWLSEDPIGFAAGDANLSRYVENSATMATDPDGLAPKWWNGIKAVFDKDAKELVLENGKRVKLRNLQFANRSVSLDDIAQCTGVNKDTIAKLRRKYGNLKVDFDDIGQPDFTPHALTEVELGDPTVGNYSTKAWNEIKEDKAHLYKNRKHYIWHHAPDGKLQLLDKDLHTAYQHTGLQAVAGGAGALGLMLVPGGEAAAEGRLNDAAREAAWSCNPLGWFSDLVSGILFSLHDMGKEGVKVDDNYDFMKGRPERRR